MLAITFDSMEQARHRLPRRRLQPSDDDERLRRRLEQECVGQSFGSISDSVTSSFDILLADAGNTSSPSRIPTAAAARPYGTAPPGPSPWGRPAPLRARKRSTCAPTSPVMLNSTTPFSTRVPSHLTNSSSSPSLPIHRSRLGLGRQQQPTITNTDDRLPRRRMVRAELVTRLDRHLVRWTGTAWDNRASASPTTASARTTRRPPSSSTLGNNIWVEWTENLQTIVWMSNY